MYAIPRNELPLLESTSLTAGYPLQTTPTYGQTFPQPSSHASSLTETYKYWPAATTSFALPIDHQQPSAPAADFTPQLQYRHNQYTPEGALRGIAADDTSLQETWQSYMNNVQFNFSVFVFVFLTLCE
jgi:hypothetical protein